MRLRIPGLLLATLSAFLLPTNAEPGSERPNVLFLAVDDLRPELGCYGAEHVHSPNIDKLAASAVTFEQAHCQLAVCNPSRVSLLTGLRPDSTRVWTLDVRFRHTLPDAVTLPQHFKSHGYQALGFGKIFHNPWPDNVSWSEPHAWPKGAGLWSDEAKAELAAFKKSLREEGKPERLIDRLRARATEIVDCEDSEHTDGAIADQALEAMRRLAKGDQPFFLAAGFVRPHLPFVVPRKYWDLYDRDAIPLAKEAALPREAPTWAMNTMYELRDYFDYLDTPAPTEGSLTEAQRRELKHGYLASVSFIDAQIGRLLDQLDRLGLAENTVVVLWSDHGWKLGEHNSWCKQTNYEIDTRVPFLIRAPGAAGNGQRSHSLVELVDVYPTLCDLAGLPLPEQLEGVSLRPILEKPETELKEGAASQFFRRDGSRDLMGYAWRTDRWRYVEWIDWKDGKVVARELYDHAADPGETRSLAGMKEHEPLMDRLSRQMREQLPPRPLGHSLRPKSTSEKPATGARPVITFRNTGTGTLTVSWLPAQGNSRVVGIIDSGGTLIQNTTAGHRFRIQGPGVDRIFTVTRKKETIAIGAPAGAGKTKEAKPADNVPRSRSDGHRSLLLHGWTLHLSDRLRAEEDEATRRMLELLDGQLKRVVDAVPEPALSRLREIPIWINPPYEGRRGTAEYHPERDWLEKNGRDPAMARAVEITNVANFPFENRRMPYLLLHELAHGYHDRVLEGGYGNAEVRAAFERARDSGTYDEVDRFDGNRIRKDKAYALSNPMEYFAESSEAYFGKNDFFPFTREELLRHDPSMHDLLRRLWQLPAKP